MKKVLALIMAAVLVMGLAACGNSKEFVFIINEEEIIRKHVDVFGFIYCMEHSLVPMEDLKKNYDDGQTYEQHYKEELEQDIIRTVLLNKEAVSKGFKLDSELKERASEKTEALIDKYGEDRLKSRGVKKSDVLEIFEWKVLGDYYADSESESHDVADTAEKTTRAEESDGNGDEINDDEINDNNTVLEATDSDERYIKVFQILFPTAKFNDEGMVSTDKDGNIVRISSAEAEKMKEDAENFSELAKNSDDIEELLKDYPVSVKGMERILKYDDLDSEYRKAVDSLSVGDVSGVIDSKYGYYVVKLLDKDDEEHGKIISDYENKIEINDAKEKLYDELYRKYIGNNNEYRNNDQWKLIVIDNYY